LRPLIQLAVAVQQIVEQLVERSLGVLKRMRLGLFVVLRALSRPAYDYYGLGDEVHLSAEILPVRVG
jgi:hypothetical protein